MPGTAIKLIREQKKITQEEVARRIGFSQNAYSKIENNITQLTINHVKQISVALDVSPMELLRGDFEIHRPLSIQEEGITRDTLIANMEALTEKLRQIPLEKHEFFPILMYDLQAVEKILSHVEMQELKK